MLRGTGKKCGEGCLCPGRQSGFSPHPQEESGQQMAAESAWASYEGLRHRKNVHDLGSCKLRPGDFQAVFVRKRFHRAGNYVSILSLLGPRAAPLPPFPGSPARAVSVRRFFLWVRATLTAGREEAGGMGGATYAAVSTHQEWQLLSACGEEEGREDQEVEEALRGRDPTCQGRVTLIQGLRAVEAHTDISHKSLRTHARTHNCT